jgi:hypothetical protein
MTPDRECTLEEAARQHEKEARKLEASAQESDDREDEPSITEGDCARFIAETHRSAAATLRALASPAQEPAPSAEAEEIDREIDSLLERHQGATTKAEYKAAGDEIRALIRRYAGDGGVTDPETIKVWPDAEYRALQAACEEARAERDAFREYAHEITKALTGIVGGGSEMFAGRIARGTPREMFKADLPFCVRRIHDRFTTLHDLVARREVRGPSGKAP